jgi:hypothetical protein
MNCGTYVVKETSVKKGFSVAVKGHVFQVLKLSCSAIMTVSWMFYMPRVWGTPSQGSLYSQIPSCSFRLCWHQPYILYGVIKHSSFNRDVAYFLWVTGNKEKLIIYGGNPYEFMEIRIENSFAPQILYPDTCKEHILTKLSRKGMAHIIIIIIIIIMCVGLYVRMCVCVYVCMYVCMYVCVCVYVYVCMCVYVCIYVCVYMYALLNECM